MIRISNHSRISSHRILGFDFGLKRIGVAIGNRQTKTAQALSTLPASNGEPNQYALDKILQQWQPALLVVGLPLAMDGSESKMSAAARKFGATLSATSGLMVNFVDERLTSVAAEHLLRDSMQHGKKMTKKRLSAIDNIAAQLILQSYLDDNRDMDNRSNINTATRIDIADTIQVLATQISSANLPDPLLIGIHTGGVWLARRLHALLGYTEPLTTLDISFYRDDFSRIGLNPQVKSSELPVAIDERNIILIDDVLYTGRTIRAAMNEIFSYGRPNQVKLGVLIDRSGREIPIQADFVGCVMSLAQSQQIKLTMKDGDQDGELELNVIDLAMKSAGVVE